MKKTPLRCLFVKMAFGVGVMTMILSSTLRAAEGQMISSKGVEVSETGLGNLIADAIRKAAGAEIALLQASVLRQTEVSLDRITPGKLAAAVMDTNEPVAVMSLTGAQIQEALERSVSLAPKPNKGFLQLSGLFVKYDQAKPQGQRVQDLKLGRRPLEPGRDYTVAMPRSLASGSLGYFRVWGDRRPAANPNPPTIGQALADFLESSPDFTAYVDDGRIRRAQ